MRVALVFLLAFLAACRVTLSPTPIAVSAPTWTRLELNLKDFATVTALAADPSRPNALFAATYDAVGMYASEDGGETWHADNAGLPRAPVFALLPLAHELFAATADGLYRRTWGADHWQRSDPVPQWAVYGLARDARGAVYAATDGRGIWVGEDGGGSWTRLPGLDDEPLLSVLPLEADTILAGTAGRGMFITHTRGETWEKVPSLENEFVTFIRADPYDAGTIYARARRGLYRSADRGRTWKKFEGGIEREVINALWLDLRWIAAAAGGGIFWSDDRGATWRAAQVENPRGRAVLTLFRIAQTLYAGTSEGLLRSSDNGETWHLFGRGLGLPLIHDIEFDGANERLLLAGEDGLYAAPAPSPADSRIKVEKLEFGAPDVPVLGVAVAPSAPHRIYVGTDGRGVLVSDDGGETWGAAGGELGGRTRVAQLVVDRNDPETVLARLVFERLYKSTNGGDAWRAVWTGMPVEEQIQTMAIAPGDPRQVWAGGDTQLFASSDGGESWRPRGLKGVSSLSIWIDPQDARRVWVGATDGVYTTADAGETWRGPYLEGLTVSAIARGAHGEWFAGTRYHGVFVSRDEGRTFTSYGLEQMSISDLLVDAAAGRVFALASDGVFQLETTP